MELKTAQDVIKECNDLKDYWSPRYEKFKRWYQLIEMVDELKTDKMESFVGNDPRAMYNLVLHLLDSDIPHRVADIDFLDPKQAASASQVGELLKTIWKKNEARFRQTGPRQSLRRQIIALLLATGWYSVFAATTDDGTECWIEAFNPAEVFPMWDDMGLSEVSRIFKVNNKQAVRMCVRNGWKMEQKNVSRSVTIHDLWWMDNDNVIPVCWNAVVVDGKLMKMAPTRFERIPIYVSAVGGLPDMGPLTDNSAGGSSHNAGSQAKSDRWRAEIGQSIVATNENVYRTWNKWWTYGLQLLRDTAQPRIFERSQSGKPIVKPEDVFRRGAIFRGGPNDMVDFVTPPPIPLEFRSSQLDLEAMMQRGGVSWAMHGNIQGQLSAFVMSQIAASANQIVKPFHHAIINLFTDIDNNLVREIKLTNARPYGLALPAGLPDDVEITAKYDIEIPGDLVQRATVARMLDPQFQLSYGYVMQKLFPDVEDPLREKAQQRADEAERNPYNAAIAYIQYCKREADYLEKNHDIESAKLYRMAAEATMGMIKPQQAPGGIPGGPPSRVPGQRPEAIPPPTQATETPI